MSATLPLVSVVVRRMYYWDLLIDDYETWKEFQQLLEECTIGTTRLVWDNWQRFWFQQLLEECTIGTYSLGGMILNIRFQQLLEECTIGTENR